MPCFDGHRHTFEWHQRPTGAAAKEVSSETDIELGWSLGRRSGHDDTKAALTALVAAHAVLGTVFLSAVNPYKSFGVDTNAGTAVTVHLGLAAAAAIVAGFAGVIIVFTSGKVVAPWLFELGVVLLAHGSLRLLWLLRELVAIVHADDHTADSSVREVAAETLFPKRTGSVQDLAAKTNRSISETGRSRPTGRT